MRSILIVFLIAVASAAAIGQQSNSVAIFSGVPENLSTGPVTFNLIPKTPGARTGKIWVRYADDGLHIYGEVAAPQNDIRWPAEKKEMLASDHVEIWLSNTTSVEMPLIGYGNQFGENDMKSADDCVPKDDDGKPGDANTADVAACRKWFADQREYRKLLSRLFTRQWLASGSSDPSRSLAYFEDFANSTWTALNQQSYADELPKVLKPKSNDGVTSQFNLVTQPSAASNANAAPVAVGYNFNFVIPWSAFPPANQLNLQSIWLMVDVFAHAPDGKKMGVLSTTSPERVWGRPATFNHVVLNVPRHYNISPCDAAPKIADIYGDPHPAWYFPTNGAEPLILSKVFDLENPAGGYEYAPSGVSPGAQEEEHFWKSLPDGSTVCGPELGYRNGKIATSSSFTVESKNLVVNRLDDGWLLVRSGPDMSTQSPFGSGQCGACDVESMSIYAISPAGAISQALNLSDRIQGNTGDPNAVDYGFSNDWSRVTYFSEFPDDPDDVSDNPKSHASSVTYCLKNHKYDECGKAEKAAMPSPPNFKAPAETQQQ